MSSKQALIPTKSALAYPRQTDIEDLILIESHEQDTDSRIQTRNYLPGVRKSLRESSFTAALEEWFHCGLQVGLGVCMESASGAPRTSVVE